MPILRDMKRSLYFTGARYFGHLAAIRLRRWQPTVISVIGSSGKTTMLHLLEAQLGSKAKYSHKANSAFGIPFHILGLQRKSFGFFEWPLFFALAPFKAYAPLPSEKIYVAESDAERPGEGKFLAELLQPDAVLWISLEEAHGINFDAVAAAGAGSGSDSDIRRGVKEAMAAEFGNFVAQAKKFSVLNADNEFIRRQSERARSKVEFISDKEVREFRVSRAGVEIDTLLGDFKLPFLLPPAASLSVVAVAAAVRELGFEADHSYAGFMLPPGRSSVFSGIKGTTLIDSSYNATMDGMRTMLDLMRRYPAAAGSEKWLVLGDMIEQGKSEEAEHRDIAKDIVAASPSRVILVGPRLQKNTMPLIVSALGESSVASFMRPDEALAYMQKELKGGETIMFKGARYLEGIVEALLADPADAAKLCRREEVWAKKRREWGV